jgi:hypothetical protein
VRYQISLKNLHKYDKTGFLQIVRLHYLYWYVKHDHTLNSLSDAQIFNKYALCIIVTVVHGQDWQKNNSKK